MKGSAVEIREKPIEARDRPTLSLCMMVRDEEACLSACLNSVKDVVDEIVVVDTGSTDRTVDVAKAHGARVYHHPWENDFSRHRNQSLSHATGDWILILDADEELRSGDGARLHEILLAEGFDSVMFTVINFFNNRTSQSHFNQVRLFRKEPEIRYSGIVHNELLGCSSTITAAVRVHHYGYDLDPKRMEAKFQRTSSLLKKRIQEEPEDFQHYHNLAVSYSMNRMPEEAADWGIKAIEISGKAEKKGGVFILWTHFIVASSFLILRDFPSAIAWARKALERFPDHPDSLFVLVMAYREMKDWPRVEEAASRYLYVHEILENDPSRLGYLVVNSAGEIWKVHLVLGEALLESDSAGEAEKSFEKALHFAPSRSVAHKGVAECYKNRSMGQEAIVHYERALESDPDSPGLLMNLGKLLDERGDQEKAERYYKRAVGIEPRLIHILLRLAKFSAKRSDIEQCLAHCKEILKALDMPIQRTLQALEDLAGLFLWIGHTLDKAGKEDLFQEAAEIALILHPELIGDTKQVQPVKLPATLP